MSDAHTPSTADADAELTVRDLVARFQLRRRATTPDFTAGVRLAREGRVTFHEVDGPHVRATVDDDPVVHVELAAISNSLKGSCTCPGGADPCHHQVAVAHALWVLSRRREAARSDSVPGQASAGRSAPA